MIGKWEQLDTSVLDDGIAPYSLSSKPRAVSKKEKWLEQDQDQDPDDKNYCPFTVLDRCPKKAVPKMRHEW